MFYIGTELFFFFSLSSQPTNGNALERHILRPSLELFDFGPDSCIAIK